MHIGNYYLLGYVDLSLADDHENMRKRYKDWRVSVHVRKHTSFNEDINKQKHVNSQYILNKIGYQLNQPILVILSYSIRSLICWI